MTNPQPASDPTAPLDVTDEPIAAVVTALADSARSELSSWSLTPTPRLPVPSRQPRLEYAKQLLTR